MGQLSVAPSPNPIPRKQKIIAAIAAVIVGHAGILWGLVNMKPIQLRPIEPPKPVQVKFVKIVEKKAEVPKPKPPEKPKDPPKPKQVKIVEKPTPPPKPVEKIQQVKAPVPIPVAAVEPQPETKVFTTTTVVKQQEPAPKADPVPNPAPAVDMTPRDLGDAAGVAWKRKPKPKFMADDLKSIKQNFIVIKIEVDAKGKISPTLIESSGNAKVDREFLRAVRTAQFQPYTENGVAVPFVAQQKFQLQ